MSKGVNTLVGVLQTDAELVGKLDSSGALVPVPVPTPMPFTVYVVDQSEYDSFSEEFVDDDTKLFLIRG